MSFPTISVPEILEVLNKCHHIYETFFNEYDKAPNRIKELADTIKYLTTILEDFEKELARYKTNYPGTPSFSRKLDECNAFIVKYSELKPVDGPEAEDGRNGKRRKLRRIWQTTKYAFEESSAELKDGLSQEMLKLNTFILVLALKRNAPETEAPSSRSSIGLSNTDLIPDLFSQIQIVRNRRNREWNQAIQANRQPDFSSSNSELENIWQSIHIRSSYARQEVPPMPEGLFENLSQQWNEIIMTLFGSSLRYPNHISAKFQHPEIVKRACTATIKLRTKDEYLQGYYFPATESGRTIVWSGVDPEKCLKHRLPSRCFPYTLHQRIGNPLQLSFTEDHKLVLQTRGRTQEINIDPTYEFETPGDQKMFQEDIRCKDLVKSFEFDKLSSARESPDGEATFQVLKLWRDRTEPKRHSISFYSSNKCQKQREFPLLWFEKAIRQSKSSKTVKIDFAALGPDIPVTSSPPPRKYPFIHRFSRSNTSDLSATSQPSSPNVATTPDSPFPHSGNTSSIDMVRSPSTFIASPRPCSVNLSPDPAILKALKFLSIRFSSAIDYSNFVSEFEKALEVDLKSGIPETTTLSSPLALQLPLPALDLDDKSGLCSQSGTSSINFSPTSSPRISRQP